MIVVVALVDRWDAVSVRAGELGGETNSCTQHGEGKEKQLVHQLQRSGVWYRRLQYNHACMCAKTDHLMFAIYMYVSVPEACKHACHSNSLVLRLS